MKWNVACYIRLSREDGDCIESESITNQRRILSEFVDRNLEFNNYKFYVDENVTGTKFDREQFNCLLKDIEKGSINCIIVKDLSRFGRNYIDAGILLEDFFPKNNVRFISILDGLDTYTDEDETTGLLVRIKNLMHDNNSREISKKVRTTNSMMRKQGKHISHAIYGYKKDPSNKYKLVIDTQVSQVVNWIFEWYANGMGVIRIAQKLNSMGIACCSEYKLTGNLYSEDELKAWKPSTIRLMLCNYSYVGCVHQGMTTTRNYKDRRKIYLDKEDHDIVENMHDAIIEKELFDTVQKMLNSHLKTRTAEHRETVYLFSGFLRCNGCGSCLVRCPTHLKGKEYVYYRCRKFKQGKKGCDSPAAIRHDHLYKAVVEAVMGHIQSCCDLNSRLKRLQSGPKRQTESFELKERVSKAQSYILRQGKLKCTAYEDWKLGTISKEDYLAIKNEIDERTQKKKDYINLIQNRIDFYSGLSDLYWLDSILKYRHITDLSREAIISLVKVIRVGQNQTVNVEFNDRSQIEKINHYLNDSVQKNEH